VVIKIKISKKQEGQHHKAYDGITIEIHLIIRLVKQGGPAFLIKAAKIVKR
jgi:hypothetical protein